ncbi:hypothetical protein OX283_010440 [Flavobacterium sp. SUN052]|uniref:hypothetical protein n=1 Tax=Flavobacterium sp. SUN052 TaxID=3002441 RepID=UPI00237D4D61|nr:hypothetical protein [Flavobacterium sp. SUN052]MEC4005077.1 hypothetical protein [Flavobacterium sp. SUN052]
MNFRRLLVSLTLLATVITVQSQSVSAEMVDFAVLKAPKTPIEAASRQFKVTVTSPYSLKTEDVIAQSKLDFQNELKNYDKTVADSEADFKVKQNDYTVEVAKANEKFALESAEFKKLSMFERLSMTDQGKNPKLVTPSKPVYYKPQPPVYREPNLNDYIIVDNNVLATQVKIDGFTRDGAYVDISLDVQKLKFQDNAGQTFANQPTKLVVKVGGVEKINKTFFQDFAFISSSPSNNINKPLEEKNHLSKVMAAVNQFLNDNFGYQNMRGSVKIQSVKNKGKYDDLEKADIYVTTNLKKMNPQNPQINASAMTNMQKGIDIWKETLTKIDYKDKKADFNNKIAEFVYFNLIRLNLALGNKTEAEKYLNEFQENQIYMKLSYDDENELKRIEAEVYKN